jgi:cold shock CspA family protein
MPGNLYFQKPLRTQVAASELDKKIRFGFIMQEKGDDVFVLPSTIIGEGYPWFA